MSSTEESTWLEELESVLADECSDIASTDEVADHISDIARPDIWETCLAVKCLNSKITVFDDIFDLPEQQILREDCLKLVSKLGNNDDDKISVLSDLESIMTCYCKTSADKRKYESKNGWIDLLLPLITLKLPRSNTYNLFEAILERYIPRHIDAFHLLRLLILYHDPQLCNFLDTKKVMPEVYASAWFQSLFASTCDLPVVLSMWDLYFQKADRYFIFFLSLVIIINARDLVLSMSNENKAKIVEMVSSLPCNLSIEDVSDFCALAQYYYTRTPLSFKCDLIFSDNETDNVKSILSQELCLPVSVDELITTQMCTENYNDKSRDILKDEDCVRFFLIDCRPAEQYNAGHPSTAFHLDCNLMLQEPNSFSTAVQALLSCQRQALAARSKAGGKHLCFLGCGDLEADQYTHMVVASFLQKHTHFVSMLTGGYKAFHSFVDYTADINVDDYLQDHNVRQCLVCKSNVNFTYENCEGLSLDLSQTNLNASDTFGKILSDIFGSVVKNKSVEMKQKLYEYIANPNLNTSGSTSTANDRHVSSSDRVGKRYRNMAPVFSIDDEHEPTDGDATDNTSPESCKLVKLSTLLKKPHIITSVKCQGVNMNSYVYDCYLVVSETHLLALRESTKPDYAYVTVNRPLSSILKITCKKKHPELVTFQYGDSTEVTDMDRFLVPNSNNVTKLISKQIMENVKPSS